MKKTDLKNTYSVICNLEMYICMILFMIIVTLLFISAILRKLSFPIQWSMDVTQLSFAWLAFLGGDIALRKGSLVGVALLTDKFSENKQKIVFIGSHIIMLILPVLFIRYGFVLVKENWDRTFQTLPISYGFVTLSLPVSSILMIISIYSNIYHVNDYINCQSSENEKKQSRKSLFPIFGQRGEK